MTSFRDRAPNLVIGLMREAARFCRRSVPVLWLAERLGVAPERLRDTIFRLEVGGLVERWIDERKRLTVVFTPLGVASYGIEYRDRKQKRRADSRTITEADLWTLTDYERSCITSLDQVAYEELHPPDHSAMDDWSNEKKRRARRTDYAAHRIAEPTVLLGERLQWPCAGQENCGDDEPRSHARETTALGPCRGCHDRPRDEEFCLICFRYPAFDRYLETGSDRPNGGRRKRHAA